jgi:hypothetical protein
MAMGTTTRHAHKAVDVAGGTGGRERPALIAAVARTTRTSAVVSALQKCRQRTRPGGECSDGQFEFFQVYTWSQP